MMRTLARGVSVVAWGLLYVGCGGSEPPVPRTVTGARTQTFWSSGGKTVRPAWDVDEPGVVLSIRTPDGRVLSTGRFDTNGGFRFDNVPGGPYFLEFVNAYGVHRFFETEASTIDLGWDVMGRPDQAYATAPTSTIFDLTGLTPATPGDVVEITASGVDVWTPLFLPGELGTGLTSASITFAWDGSDLPLIDGSKGDRTWVHQLSAHTDPASGLPYLAASAYAALPSSFGVLDGSNGTASVALQPVSQTATITADWKFSTFEAALQDWPAGTTLQQHGLTIEALAFQAERGPQPASGFPDLLLAGALPGTTDRSLSIPYGRFLDASWAERISATLLARTDYDWNGVIFFRNQVGTVAPAGPGPKMLAPVVTPIRTPRIGGRDATQVQSGVGLTPVLSWTAPRMGTVTRTAIDLYEISVIGDFSSTEIASFEVLGTSMQMPSGLLRSGATYAVVLTALSEEDMNPRQLLEPYRRPGTGGYATFGLAPFSP